MGALKYTAEILAPIVEGSVSYAEVLRRLGLKFSGGSQGHFKKVIALHGLDTSHFLGQGSNKGAEHRGGPNKKPWQEVLILRPDGTTIEQAFRLRRAMIEYGILYRCFDCGNEGLWRGKPLTLQVDHRNGNRMDNRPDNVRFSCPNCHAQTDNFGANNSKSKKSIYTVGLTTVRRNK